MFDTLQEQELKRRCAETEQANQTTMGCAGKGLSEPRRESLRERVARNASRAHREAIKANKLEELIYLLDKNPEVARILDLVSDLGV